MDGLFDEKTLKLAHSFSNNNMRALGQDKQCGCFYCMQMFIPAEIKEWIIDDTDCDRHGTALWPRCGIDAVIGESSGYVITKEFLKAMNKYWF